MESLTLLDKAEQCEGEDPILVERWLEGEVEAGQRLDRRKPPHPQRGLDTAILAQRQLLGEQMSMASNAESSPCSRRRTT